MLPSSLVLERLELPSFDSSPRPAALMSEEDFEFRDYSDESILPSIQRLVSKDLSEPYSVFTYRYFLCSCPLLDQPLPLITQILHSRLA